jgi:hypothetical protein
MGYTTTAYMGLTIPGVGTENGPAYALDINNCLRIIDGHNHSEGLGVKIPSSGLDINDSLTLNGFSLLQVKSVSFQVQSSKISGSQTACLYSAPLAASNGIYDLYYNDGAGAQIPITKNGLVFATATSIDGEGYYGGTFTWQQWDVAGTPPANFDLGSIVLRNNIAGTTNGITLSAQLGLTGNTNFTLPIPPTPVAGIQILQMDTLGNVTANLVADGTTIVNTSGKLSVAIGGLTGITGTQLANNTITNAQIAPTAAIERSKLGALGQQISASCGAFTAYTSVFVSVTNLSVTLTTTGRPVFLTLIGANNTSNTGMTVANEVLTYAFVRDGGRLTNQVVQPPTSNNCSANTLTYIDPVAAGTYVYTFQVKSSVGSNQIVINGFKLVAFEL